ncbi:hypothetical protein BH10BAC2_BH10BAC2_42420 [soil metagenome]
MMTEENNLLQKQIILATGNQLTVQNTGALFTEKLADYIHQLIDNDFEKLISILYRLDVSEKKLKTLLAERSAEDAGLLIANAIIERQLQKIASRKKYTHNTKDIPEEEKW